MQIKPILTKKNILKIILAWIINLAWIQWSCQPISMTAFTENRTLRVKHSHEEFHIFLFIAYINYVSNTDPGSGMWWLSNYGDRKCYSEMTDENLVNGHVSGNIETWDGIG